MVGTFYSAPEPGAQAYVKVGSRANVGQVEAGEWILPVMDRLEVGFVELRAEVARDGGIVARSALKDLER